MFPSMLDPAFDEDEDPSPRPIAKEVELNSARSMEMDTRLIEKHIALKAAHQTQKNKLSVTRFTDAKKNLAVLKREPITSQSDYYNSHTMLRQSSLLKGISYQNNRPLGIKEYAW